MKKARLLNGLFCFFNRIFTNMVRKLNAFNIVIIYLVMGSIWILLSDKLVGVLVKDSKTLVEVSIYKGWFYVICTAILLYILIDSSIKEIKNSKRELKISEERYRLVINNTTDGMWEWDILTNEIIYPMKLMKSLGYSHSDLQDKSSDLGRFLHNDDLVMMKKSIKEYLKRNVTNYKFETRVISKCGESIWIQIKGHTIWNDDGSPLKMFGTVTDINERKITEVALKNTMEENKRLLNEVIEYDKLKTEFFTNISHEFRTPLNVILSVVQVLSVYEKKGEETVSLKKVNKYMTNVRKNCYRLLKLINNLIDVTRIDLGFLKLKMKNEDIVNIVRQVVNSVDEFISVKELKLTFNSDVQKKIMAFDVNKFERILLNLVSNAIKFTKPGGEIFIKVRDLNDVVKISVKDTGVGIEKNKLAIIFDRFRQVNSSLAKESQGSGIGLSIVKSLVEMHNGQIEVDSEVGVGTEFILSFPVKILSSDEIDDKYDDSVNMRNDGVERALIELSDIYLPVDQHQDI